MMSARGRGRGGRGGGGGGQAHAPRFTTQLPSSLLAELVDSGQLAPGSTARSLRRKDVRAQEREALKSRRREFNARSKSSLTAGAAAKGEGRGKRKAEQSRPAAPADAAPPPPPSKRQKTSSATASPAPAQGASKPTSLAVSSNASPSKRNLPSTSASSSKRTDGKGDDAREGMKKAAQIRNGEDCRNVQAAGLTSPARHSRSSTSSERATKGLDTGSSARKSEPSGSASISAAERSNKKKPQQQQRPKTALERLLEQQERAAPSSSSSSATARESRSKGGSARALSSLRRRGERTTRDQEDDDEIAWLEHALRHDRAAAQADAADDGLGELLDGMDDLERAAFGASESESESESESDDSEDSDLESGSALEESESESVDDAVVLSDDGGDEDDVRVLSGEASADDDDEQMVDLDGDEDAPVPPPRAAAAASANGAPTRYVPPHLRRQQEAEAAASRPGGADNEEEEVVDPELARRTTSLINKLTSRSLLALLPDFLQLYATRARARVSAALVLAIVRSVQMDDTNAKAQVALVSALAGESSIGLELPARLLERVVRSLDEHTAPNQAAASEEAQAKRRRIVSLLAEAYNFELFGPQVVWSFVRERLRDDQHEMDDADVEDLLRLFQRSGASLRRDDPTALKEIVSLAQAKSRAATSSSRMRFMLETLTGLRDNKHNSKHTGFASVSGGADLEHESLRKALIGARKRAAAGAGGAGQPDALRVSFDDVRNSSKRGKWWLVGHAWSGDPLAELDDARGGHARREGDDEDELQEDAERRKVASLARQHGMNTEVRRQVFAILLSADDFVDASTQLRALCSDTLRLPAQRREVARVVVHCAGAERVYNPFYTLVCARMAGEPDSQGSEFALTMQYALWDFVRAELGEKRVAGQSLQQGADAKTHTERGGGRRGGEVDDETRKKAENLAKLYGWCIAQGALSLHILKPMLPLTTLGHAARRFAQSLLDSFLLSTQTRTPLLSTLFLPPSAASSGGQKAKRDARAMERALRAALAPRRAPQRRKRSRRGGADDSEDEEMLLLGIDDEAARRERLDDDDDPTGQGAQLRRALGDFLEAHGDGDEHPQLLLRSSEFKALADGPHAASLLGSSGKGLRKAASELVAWCRRTALATLSR